MSAELAYPAAAFLLAYLVGSIPWAYIIVRGVTGGDVTEHGTGNVGAMNVRRSTGSWAWFAVAMVADASKGLVPALLAKLALAGSPPDWGMAVRPWAETLASISSPWASNPVLWVPMLAVAGAVFGHNYSVWMALVRKRFVRTGKGLATGGGALLGYDWRYFLAVVIVGLTFIAVTRYMMAGQVAAAATLPVTAFVLRAPDAWFALAMGVVVYVAHHKRFVGLLRGKEPRMYVQDRMGPRG